MTDTKRVARLRHTLTERRREMQNHVAGGIHDGRSTNRSNDGADDFEMADACVQGDTEFALLQMRAETLRRIEEALVRLDAGEYGTCVECDGEISEPRLQALPFAVRCTRCEEGREQKQGHARQIANQRNSFSLFPDRTS
jgi:RNA polymerase-binding transcription factor